jgi:hypothetical protein
MKKFICLSFLLVGLLAWFGALSQGVAINNDNSSPDASAMLDVKSTTKGMLAPRMTMAQRNAIISPATGLMIYQTDINPGMYYNSGTPAIPAWFIVGNNAGQWLNNGSDIYYALGKVGIGTTSPIEKLHVDGYMHLSNTSNYPFIRFNNTFTGGNSGLEFKENGVDKAWIYYNGTYNSLYLSADNTTGLTPHLVIKSDGNVGLGTQTPASHLHVTKALGTRTGTFGTDISPWTSGTNVAVGNDDEDAVLYVGQTPGYEGFLIWQYNANPALGYYSIGTFNGANNMTLQEYGGNVGVRTNAPAALFHVAEESPGYTGLFGTPISSWTSSTNVSIGDDNGSSVLYVGQSQNNKGFVGWMYDPTPSSAFFGIGTYLGTNSLILQQAGGNVGIGTFYPYSRLQVDYNSYGQSSLGYNSINPAYLYHTEVVADGDGQSNLYGFRNREAQNDGTGYGIYTSNCALKGYSFWGDLYSFGTTGFNYNDFTRCGGILGADGSGSYWGALGYRSSGSINYGGYATSYGSGGGKNGQANTGIGLGAWGDLMGADIHGAVYGIYAEGKNYAMFSNGPIYRNNLDIHLQDNGTGTNTVLYTNVSTDATIQTCGTAALSNGTKSITFDPAFEESVSLEAPVIVTVTPIGNSNGVYLSEVSGNGFTVVENNGGKSNITVNYIAIGKRAGYENPSLPQEVIDAGYTKNMARGLHNDADTQTNGEGLYYENGQLVVGIHPSTLPDPNKPAEETVLPKPSTPPNKGVANNLSLTGSGEPGQVQRQVLVKEIPNVEESGRGKIGDQPVQQSIPAGNKTGTASEKGEVSSKPANGLDSGSGNPPN